MEANTLTGQITQAEPKARSFVRLTTHRWADRRGIHFEKRISYLQRKTVGFNFFEEDVCNVGAEVIDHITNLFECEDGIYEILICNEHRDWETGTIDDYDYLLSEIPKHTLGTDET